MAFSWTESITQGDQILEDVLAEIRDNSDTLEDESSSVPSGTVAYFYQASAPTGWTTDDTVGDHVLAVHGTSTYDGSTGGGETQGTWTQDDHTHTGPSHLHQWHAATASGSADQTFNSGGSTISMSATTNSNYGVYSPSGSQTKLNAHYYTTLAGTGDTGGDTTANTWRPTANVGIIASKDA